MWVDGLCVPVGQGECQAPEDPGVQDGHCRQDEGPPDPAVPQPVVLRVGPADPSHVVVVPASGETQDADRHTHP